MHISQRVQQISPFYVMDILASAKKLEEQGHDVIHLEVGEPDFATPTAVAEAAKRAIEQGNTFYTPATGLPALRHSIARYYQDKFAVTVSPDRVVVTPGASGALQLVLSSVVDPGQTVLMADPGYPCNRHFVQLLQGIAKQVKVDATSAYQLSHQIIEDNWDDDTCAVLLASPSNPTGTLIGREEMQKIIQLVESKHAVLIVDEIYQGLVYDQAEYTAAELSQNVFIINSFSKYFSMTGWRLGWLLAPERFIESIDRLAQNLFLAAPTISQYAALAAFHSTTLSVFDLQRDELKARRDFLYAGLLELGFIIRVKPGGAFYIYADVSPFTSDSFTFCRQLLEESFVAITPGLDFGVNQAEKYVRFAYTQPVEKLELALQRIRNFLLSCG